MECLGLSLLTLILHDQNAMEAEIHEESCPVCLEPLDHSALVTGSCGHYICSECLDKVMGSPPVDDAGELIKYKQDQRSCASIIVIISTSPSQASLTYLLKYRPHLPGTHFQGWLLRTRRI